MSAELSAGEQLTEADLTPGERGAIMSGRVNGVPVGTVAAACHVFAEREAAAKAAALREAADDLRRLNEIGQTRRDLISDEDWGWFCAHAFRHLTRHNTSDVAPACETWLRDRADQIATLDGTR